MKKILLINIILLFVAMSCDTDDYLTVKPKGSAFQELFANPEGVNKLLIGSYSKLSGNADWASSVTNWVWGDVASDDYYKGSSGGDQATINPIEGFYPDAQNEYVKNLWRDMYDGITRCNSVLSTLALMDETIMADTDKAKVAAQARFLRAHYYFELTKVYLQVPYIDENTEDPTMVPNDHVLWSEIEADLNYAKDNLPNSWPGEPGRVTQWAAKSLLAYVYMFQKKWSDAKPLLIDVKDNGISVNGSPLGLTTTYEMNILARGNNNNESIWEIQYIVNDGSDGSHNANWGDALNFPYTFACCGFHQPTQNFVNAFKTGADGHPMFDNFDASDVTPNAYGSNYSTSTLTKYTGGSLDPRVDLIVGRPGAPFLDFGILDPSWVREVSNGGPYLNQKNMWLKAEEGQSRTSTGWANGINDNNFRKIRLAHIYLWLAECYVEADNNLSEAVSLVNEIRNRAKESLTSPTDWLFYEGEWVADYKVEPYASFGSKEEALKAIRHEDRLEFGGDGMRFFDLVRWGIADQVMNKYLADEGRGIFTTYLLGRSFIKGKNEYWPIPQTEVELSGTDESGNHVVKQVAPGWTN